MDPHAQHVLDFEPAPAVRRAWLCVLASGSAGNCSVLAIEGGGRRWVYLIDLGLSHRRVNRLLAGLGVSYEDLAGVLITHLDTDHFSPSWTPKLPARVPIFMHRRHLGRAGREGILHRRCEALDPRTRLPGGVDLATRLHDHHDSLGVSIFRFELGDKRSLGFATDLGCATPELIDHLRTVDVLAIESNYCPRMQVESDRPDFLKQRIMGGAGHLSNQQCVEAVRQISPREHVVLLHLSRQCNTPTLAAAGHAEAPYRLTVTSQVDPTALIDLAGAPPAVRDTIAT